MLGIAPHSGWAAAALVAGTPLEPRVILRERLELSDTRLAGSKQPYHELEGLPLAQAQRQLARLCTSAGGLAQSALRSLLERAQTAGVEPRAAGILDSSGRSGATVTALGRGMGSPWGADQKDAALLAWLLLAAYTTTAV